MTKKKEKRKKRKLNKANPELRQIPRTIENTREADETIVQENDEEVLADDKTDEFSKFFAGEVTPKIMITTQKNPHAKIYDFLKEFIHVIPNMYYYKRRDFDLKDICDIASSKGFTCLIVVQEKMKELHGMYICSLPDGCTSYFRVTSLKLGQDMNDGATCSAHKPELVFTNFDTRLGHRLGRQLRSLFPLDPEYNGRRVISLHNQRDFIFFRHYRYTFKVNTNDATKQEQKERCQLQEIGPFFTMKLRWIHAGVFDTTKGEFEYLWRPDAQVSRKKFFI